MTAINERYTREIRNRFGYSGTWLPTTQVRVGDVGVLHNYEYVRVRSLRELGVRFRERTDTASANLEYASAGVTSSEFTIAGEAPAASSLLGMARAGISIAFNAENAFLFSAYGCRTSSIEDQTALSHSLLGLVARGDWPDDHVVVTEVVFSERSTILASSSSGARIELSAETTAAAGSANLVSGSVRLRPLKAHNMALQIVAQGGLTPLFRAWGIKRRFLQQPTFVRRGQGTGFWNQSEQDRHPDGYFEDVDYAYFVNT